MNRAADPVTDDQEKEKKEPRMQPMRTVTIEAGRLIDALDSLADVAGAIERQADGHGPSKIPTR